MLTIALSKGRIFDETLPLLEAAGIVPAEDRSVRASSSGDHPGRRAHRSGEGTDVPTYVQYVLRISESPARTSSGARRRGLYQPLDLGIARCRMMVAVRAGFDYDAAIRRAPGSRLQPNIDHGTRAFAPRACTSI